MTDRDRFAGGIVPGEPACDAPVERDGQPIMLADCLGPAMSGLYFANPDGSLSSTDGEALAAIAELGVKPVVLLPPFCPFVGEAALGRVLDQSGVAHERYDANPGTFYLIGADRRVIARWRRLALAEVQARLSQPRAGRSGDAPPGAARR
jgi:3-(3-hydroxy-phenyl)propionate hydroxylase